MTLPYLIWLDDVQQPITQAMLYDEGTDDLVMSFVRNRGRDGLPYLTVDLDNPGWELWETGQTRYCALVESDDGTLAGMRILGRGTIRSLPPAVSGETITLNVECSPDADAVRDAKEVVAAGMIGVPLPSEYDEDGTLRDTDPTAEQLPYQDRLRGRLEYLADSIPLTRHGYWHCDPVTHAMTWRMHRTRRRVLNIADVYDPDSLQVTPGKGAVREVRCKLISAFNIAARGTCNIGPWIGEVTSLTGYGSSGSGGLSQNAGWSIGQPGVRTYESQTAALDTGRAWEVQYRRISYVQTLLNTTPPTTRTDTLYGPVFTQRHTESVRLKSKRFLFDTWLATYSWNQPLREVLDLVLRFPIQPGATGVVDFVDLGNVQISDPHGIEGLSGLGPFEDDRVYNRDDTVLMGGQAFRASVDGLTGFWLSQSVGKFSAGTVTSVRDPRWIPLDVAPALADPAAVEFLPTIRGCGTIANQLLRMAVVGLDRLMEWTVTVTAQRADLLDLTGGVDLDLIDAIRILLPGRQDTDELKPVIGYLMRAEERWHGDDGETVTLTLAVPTGTGIEGVAREASAGSYVAPGYVESGYVEEGTPHLTAGPDIEWTLAMEDLRLNVNPAALSDPGYSLGGSYRKRNQADEQIAKWKTLAATAQDPMSVDGLGDTDVELAMRPLVVAPVVDRKGTVIADMVWCPRGIRLTDQGEP